MDCFAFLSIICCNPTTPYCKDFYSYSVQLLDFATLNDQQKTSLATYSPFSLIDTFNSFCFHRPSLHWLMTILYWESCPLTSLPLFLIFWLIIYSVETPWWDVPKPWEHNRTSGHGPAIHGVSWKKNLIFPSGLSAQLLIFQVSITFSIKRRPPVVSVRKEQLQARHSTVLNTRTHTRQWSSQARRLSFSGTASSPLLSSVKARPLKEISGI